MGVLEGERERDRGRERGNHPIRLTSLPLWFVVRDFASRSAAVFGSNLASFVEKGFRRCSPCPRGKYGQKAAHRCDLEIP